MLVEKALCERVKDSHLNLGAIAVVGSVEVEALAVVLEGGDARDTASGAGAGRRGRRGRGNGGLARYGLARLDGRDTDGDNGELGKDGEEHYWRETKVGR